VPVQSRRSIWTSGPIQRCFGTWLGSLKLTWQIYSRHIHLRKTLWQCRKLVIAETLPLLRCLVSYYVPYRFGKNSYLYSMYCYYLPFIKTAFTLLARGKTFPLIVYPNLAYMLILAWIHVIVGLGWDIEHIKMFICLNASSTLKNISLEKTFLDWY